MGANETIDDAYFRPILFPFNIICLPSDYSGILRFDEIGKDIEYILPEIYSKEPLFVISMEKK